ncbi:hypothetical protein [Caulobacter endophyticus]|uniref:hypothetical protein n=1 Tax=Caulobacter endophyticus TaxID=2172652 RepID=UPI002410B13D|nr:hypothetical protein [Caulobacter endophyticus]MDG2530299.1 hypothetical protein [Caulobacter endophyticus]
MRRTVLATLLALAASAPALAGPDAGLFSQRETGGPDVRYGAAIARGYDALAAGREGEALKALRTADSLPLHEAANYALLPQIAWLQARSGDTKGAGETARMARLAVALETGAARCGDAGLEARGYDVATRKAAALRYCNAFGGPKTDELYRRKLAAVEAGLR